MRKIAFIGCSAKKNNGPCIASKMYKGHLFIYSLRYCIKSGEFDEIYILSAKYGILKLNQNIIPYNKTLNKMNKIERKMWKDKVIKQINKLNIKGEFFFFCGHNYHYFLKGNKVFNDLPIGKSLQKIKRMYEELKNKITKGINYE